MAHPKLCFPERRNRIKNSPIVVCLSLALIEVIQTKRRCSSDAPPDKLRSPQMTLDNGSLVHEQSNLHTPKIAPSHRFVSIFKRYGTAHLPPDTVRRENESLAPLSITADALSSQRFLFKNSALSWMYTR